MRVTGDEPERSAVTSEAARVAIDTQAAYR